MTHILKKRVDVMSTVVETSRLPLLEIPRRFTFSEVAHTRHNSSKLDSALTYSQTDNSSPVGDVSQAEG